MGQYLSTQIKKRCSSEFSYPNVFCWGNQFPLLSSSQSSTLPLLLSIFYSSSPPLNLLLFLSSSQSSTPSLLLSLSLFYSSFPLLSSPTFPLLLFLSSPSPPPLLSFSRFTAHNREHQSFCGSALLYQQTYNSPQSLCLCSYLTPPLQLPKAEHCQTPKKLMLRCIAEMKRERRASCSTAEGAEQVFVCVNLLFLCTYAWYMCKRVSEHLIIICVHVERSQSAHAFI